LRFAMLLAAFVTAAPIPSAWAQQSYLLGPGDLIKVSVVELEQIANEYRVDSQGSVNLPYLGRVPVKDKTVAETIELLTERLKAGFVNDPHVYVEVVEYNYRPISVIGAVNQPGKLKIGAQNLSLVEAIVQAGGVTENAGDDIIIIRLGPDAGHTTTRVSYSKLMLEGVSGLNIPLQAGDTVNIPPARKIVVSVLGEVNKPGQYSFKSTDRVTLLRVIAAAGGFTDYARRNRVIVKRAGAKEERHNARDIESGRDIDPELGDDDIVIVP